ncbi:MAG: glutamine amidotransferase [Armatimonadota bacterium]
MKKRLLYLLLIAVLCSQVFAADDTFGVNLMANPSFETLDPKGLPVDWTFSGTAKVTTFTIDEKVVLTGSRAFKVDVPEAGNGSVSCKAIPVEGGKQYLFSLGLRQAGFGAPGTYSGVDAYCGLRFRDAAGKDLGGGGIGFPYHGFDWDLRDEFYLAPPTAATAVVTVTISNHSLQTGKKNIPSTLWLDGMQLRQYTPPPTPEWATKPPERIVEGGWSTSRVVMPPVGGLNMAGGKWGPIVTEEGSTFGSVLRSPVGVGTGIMGHSPYYMNPPPGLYRAVIRCKVADNTAKEEAGFTDFFTEKAGQRAVIHFLPTMFTKPNTYQDFTVDFVLRTTGYWGFRIYTTGKQVYTADSVRVFPVVLFQDRQLLDIYPGSDGIVPENLQPKRGEPFTGMLLAGPLYDYLKIVDAFHLTSYHGKLNTVWVDKGNAQKFIGFPEVPDELFKNNVIAFVDVDCSALGLRQKRMLVEYVRRGGGLVIFGGHKALDRGGMRGSLLDEMLPVEWAEDNTPLAHAAAGFPLAKGERHPITDFLKVDAKPVCFFMHDLKPRAGAQTVLTAGGKPALVLGAFGKGRVAVLTLTCFGDPQPGQQPFWEWSPWTNLLRDLCWWTAGEDGHF